MRMDLMLQKKENKMIPGPIKTKEVVIYFGKQNNKDIIPVDDQPIERTHPLVTIAMATTISVFSESATPRSY